MNSFLSHLHTQLRNARTTMHGATHYPHEVPWGVHKEYPRMERTVFEKPDPLKTDLSAALHNRHSTMHCDAHAPFILKELGELFGHSLRRRDNSTSRQYPSGGALYPIETYLVINAECGVESGVFHYHPTAHALEKLWSLPSNFSMKKSVPHPNAGHIMALIVFTSVWERSSAKYGDLAYLHAVLEAGHMSENILLVATALGLDTRPMAGFDDRVLGELLDLDKNVEQVVHTVTLCKSR